MAKKKTQTETKAPAESFSRIEAVGKILAKSKAPMTVESLVTKSDKLYADQLLKSRKSNLKSQEFEVNWAVKLLKAAEVLEVDGDKIKLK